MNTAVSFVSNTNWQAYSGENATHVAQMLGTNGGGFFNANSARPFENPTPFSNLLGMILIVGGLTFFPALALGPIAEHVAMAAGRWY